MVFIYSLFVTQEQTLLLSGVTSDVYDKSDAVTKPLLVGMGYTGDDQDAILEYLTWQKNKSHTNLLIRGPIDVSV